MEIGDRVELVIGHRDLSGKGPYLIAVKNTARTHDFEAIREVFTEFNIEAIIVSEDLIADIHRLSPLVIEDLKQALDDLTAQNPLPETIGLTPERVVAALRKRPDLLEGVRRLLAG